MTDNTPAIRESQQLERYVGPRSWGDLVRQADILYRSGMLPKTVRSTEAAIAIIQTGRELQLNPMEAFRMVHVIEGVPTVSPRCKLALIQRSGLLAQYRVVDGDGWAECTMRRRGLPDPVTVRFTLEDAKAAGIAGKDNWRKWPRNMLRWRAIGYVADQLFSDVTGGHFTPDELGADTDEEGVPMESETAEARPSSVAVDAAHMRAVNEAWMDAQRAGWQPKRIGEFFSQLGATRKTEITIAMLDKLREAMSAPTADVVDANDWKNDPALEGL